MATERRRRNVELARGGMEAYARGEVEAVIATLDPEVVVYAPPAVLNAGTWHGREGFRNWIDRWNEAWQRFEIVIEAVEAVGEDHALVHVHQTAHGRSSSIAVDQRMTFVFEVSSDGAFLTYLAVFPSPDDAREHARAREEAGGAHG